MRLELINCEGSVLKCTIDRFNINLYAYLLDGQGYMRIVPQLEDLYQYLIGQNSFKDVLKSSKEIKINNIIVDLNDINLNDIHSVNKKIIDHSDQHIDQKSIVMMIQIVESRLSKKLEHNFRLKSKDYSPTSTYLIIRPIVNSIREMDTLQLATHLDEDSVYMGTSMYLFLAILRDKFQDFKIKGDTSLNVKIISRKALPVNLVICCFKGKNSKMTLQLEFHIIKKIVNILNTKNKNI